MLASWNRLTIHLVLVAKLVCEPSRFAMQKNHRRHQCFQRVGNPAQVPHLLLVQIITHAAPPIFATTAPRSAGSYASSLPLRSLATLLPSVAVSK